MSLAARLNRLTPALSAKQRALLVIHAHLMDTEPDPDVLATMPEEQRREYDYYVALLYTSNGALGILCECLAGMVKALERDLEQHDLLGRGAAVLEEEAGAAADAETVRDMRSKGRISVPEFLRRLQGELRQKVLDEVKVHWQEQRALEVVWEEIAGECDGEDIRSSYLKNLASETRDRLLALSQQLGGRRRLPEPSDQVLATIRSHADEAMRMMGFREPEQ